MSPSQATIRLSLMDWHGTLLDHDPVGDRLIRSPFQPGIFPGLIIEAPSPLTLPADLLLSKTFSGPKPFPALTMTEADNGLVALFDASQNLYLTSCIHPYHHNQVVVRAAHIMEWEKFLPLSEDDLRGLSVLMTPTALAVTRERGGGSPSFRLGDEGMQIWFDDQAFQLVANLETIRNIGSLHLGEKQLFVFQALPDQADLALHVRRL